MFGLHLRFAIFFDMRVDAFGKVQIAVDVARIRIFRVRNDRKFLLLLVFQYLLTPWRVVVTLADLFHQRSSLRFIDVFFIAQQLNNRVVVNKVTSHHDENQPAVMPDIFAALQRVEQMSHHFILSQFVHVPRVPKRTFDLNRTFRKRAHV
jgi:hypothetical protein